MKIPQDKFTFKKCAKGDLDEILKLQDTVYDALPYKSWLRKNTVEMLSFCLEEPNYTIGVWYEGKLIAISILYVPLPEDTAEMLATSLKGVEIDGLKHANYKLCLVNPEYRGNGLQRTLENKLENYAKKKGISLLCATVFPENIYSVRNIEGAGYKLNKEFRKYGLKRRLYYKFI